MNTILVAGYRVLMWASFPIKTLDWPLSKAIERDLRRLFEEGVKWLVFSGNLDLRLGY